MLYNSGDKVSVFNRGNAIILKPAKYVGRSGPGYYAAYDPPHPNCAQFWVHDGILTARA